MSVKLEGKTIKEVRRMTPKEQQDEGWYEPTIVLILSDGTKLYPSQDEEGNGPGALFGRLKNGKNFIMV